jgi:hypothetical protein|tara:strand:+ start:1350 stop:1601 length:252 start_codon:yes stop_codon:yes gene_type:complete
VAFYAVGTDPVESYEKLAAYRDKQGYPWPIAQAGDGMLSKFRVLQQSTKIAFNGRGTVVYRDLFGMGSDERWRELFDELWSSG